MSGRKIILLMLIFCLFGFVSRAQNNEAFTAVDYEIEMNNWTSAAQLTLPDETETPPLVILFHGSGPYDMNATYSTEVFSDEEPVSENFLTIAETLAQEGVAVLRFNKRGVNAYGDYDFAQVQASSLDVLIEDANDVIDFALDIEAIDSERIYLYGWSEGAWVIANVATMRDDIAGLIMQGAPDGDLADTLAYQYQELTPDYLNNTVDTDGDGLLSVEDVAGIPPGPVQYMIPFFFYQQGSDPANPTINSFVDSNGDEMIDIDGELVPMINMYLSNLPAYLPQVDASYETSELVVEASILTLLLHGTHDGWTPLSGAEAIAEAAPDVVTLNVYENLGHALSITENPVEDGFYPMELEPLNDLIEWIESAA